MPCTHAGTEFVSRSSIDRNLLDNSEPEAETRLSLANFMAKIPRLLDRALIGLVILVVLVLLGMEVVMAGGPPLS